ASAAARAADLPLQFVERTTAFARTNGRQHGPTTWLFAQCCQQTCSQQRRFPRTRWTRDHEKRPGSKLPHVVQAIDDGSHVVAAAEEHRGVFFVEGIQTWIR